MRVLKTGLAGILATGVAPLIFTRGAYAQEFCNAPTGDTVTLGFNMPLTGAYADEGADEQRAFELAVEHLNGGGDGGMITDVHVQDASRATASWARRSPSSPATPRPRPTRPATRPAA